VDGRLDERKNRRTDGYTEMEISGGDRGQIRGLSRAWLLKRNQNWRNWK